MTHYISQAQVAAATTSDTILASVSDACLVAMLMMSQAKLDTMLAAQQEMGVWQHVVIVHLSLLPIGSGQSPTCRQWFGAGELCMWLEFTSAV